MQGLIFMKHIKNLNDHTEKISLSKLKELIDPFKRVVWVNTSSPLTREEILKATPISPKDSSWHLAYKKEEYVRRIHAGRILWLMQNWSDNFPIKLDFGVPVLNHTPAELILDGYHRFMAAIMLNLKCVNAICSGQISKIEKFRCV